MGVCSVSYFLYKTSLKESCENLNKTLSKWQRRRCGIRSLLFAAWLVSKTHWPAGRSIAERGTTGELDCCLESTSPFPFPYLVLSSQHEHFAPGIIPFNEFVNLRVFDCRQKEYYWDELRIHLSLDVGQLRHMEDAESAIYVHII